jgi:hypothetical protein
VHTYIQHTHIPWIRKFVTATTGCGIHHRDAKDTNKCSNNKTRTQKQNNETTGKYIFKML